MSQHIFDLIRKRRFYFLLLILLLLLGCSSNPTHSEQKSTGLLWRIESPALSAPSYLFGTIHSDDERVTQLAEPVQQAFDQAKQFALEVELEASASKMVAMKMYYTDGQTLENVIGQPMYQQSVKALKTYGIPEDMVAIMKPWAAFTVLNMPKPGNKPFLDARLYKDAKAAHKQIIGLESMQEQVDVFDQMPLKYQIAILKTTLENQNDLDSILDETLEVYLSRDLNKMQALNDKYLKLLDAETAQIFTDRLLLNRNHHMADRIALLLKKNPTFVAIGALHLPGEQGVIDLLRQKGFNITPIY
ncbi:MAG: TraB/GumN family protein [Gammaproteobacteria bacterium]|nr:TraB/GumN family protein [Gammaproteobacteria bacterium]